MPSEIVSWVFTRGTVLLPIVIASERKDELMIYSLLLCTFFFFTSTKLFVILLFKTMLEVVVVLQLHLYCSNEKLLTLQIFLLPKYLKEIRTLQSSMYKS